MNVTIDLARRLRCCGPVGCGERVAGFTAAKRGIEGGEGRYCIASDCMAWRVSDQYVDMGHCGLAGKPTGVMS